MHRPRLDLYCNFTYVLDDPEHGDQFHQAESRQILGLNAERTWQHKLGSFASEIAIGVQLPQDRLSPVGLYLSEERRRLSTVREDEVKERSSALYFSNSTTWTPWLRTAAWQLDLESELIFIGDAGTTEAGRPSRRHGVELTNFYSPAKDWIIDANLAWSHARFRDSDPAGDFIPGSISRTASVGVSGEAGPWSGGMRLRYFGPRALVEDDSVRSPSSTLVNMKLGYKLAANLKLTVEVLNLLNRRVSDIDYYYESQLPGEAAPVADIHTHPGEMRTLRAGLAWRF
ncbi:TonB-dependent receptor domain-containing protein [Duganella sp. FT27W]|uniref:TonB-dependent receptor domain-containing protein n=1 Tax=Duganella sp. FT27W TaxID=2654636 RepID=UPI00186BAB2C|nr:TonB-dependent receptor [Duganella sp. FT27W]